MRVQRRAFLRGGALGALGLLPWAASGQSRIPIADLHSHYGLITRPFAASGLADDMRAQRVALMAWKMVADKPWIAATPRGIVQSGEPVAGALRARFHAQFDRMRAYAEEHALKLVLTAADVEACVAADGPPGLVLASEGADFLEGNLEHLAAAHGKGLRHLQCVHYIRTPVGDFQTVAPVHGGFSPMGKSLIEACNDQGILVDLAHSTAEAVEQALQIAKVPLVWSHGWVDRAGGRFTDPYGFLQRRLSLELARGIAAKGGVVGLWALGVNGPSRWIRARDTHAYAEQLADLVDKIGREHVAFGTDIEGVGPNWVVNDYAGVRTVIEHLQQLKLPSETVECVAYRNYARVLKAALR